MVVAQDVGAGQNLGPVRCARPEATRMPRAARLCALLGLLLPAAASAQDAQPRMSTKAEYAACLDASDTIDRRKQALSKRGDELAVLSAKFKAADADLAAQVGRHAPRTPTEIASYNRAIDTRNQAVKEYNERVRSIEREQSELNALILQTNASCGSLRLSPEVKEAVEAERRNRSQGGGAPRAEGS